MSAPPVYYLLGCAAIATISVHDAMLIVVNHQVIQEVEQNPIGCWLIDVAGGSIWLFVGVKLLSTSFVMTALVLLYQTSQRLAKVVMPAIGLFQLCLLGYLSLA